jgi:hypothetical protein
MERFNTFSIHIYTNLNYIKLEEKRTSIIMLTLACFIHFSLLIVG